MWPIKYTIKCPILFYFISFAEEAKQTKKTYNVIKLKKGQGHRNSWGQLQRARVRIMLGLHNPETCIFNILFRTDSSSTNNRKGENMYPSLLDNSSTCDGGSCCFWFQETGLVKANRCNVRKFYICKSGEKLKIIITKLLLLLWLWLLLWLLLWWWSHWRSH